MRHVIQCPSCRQTFEIPPEAPAGELGCKGCGASFLNLGLIPDPVTDLPLGPGTLPAPDPVNKPSGPSIPKWCCAWCGRAVTSTDDHCARCKTDLARTPCVQTAARVTGISPALANALIDQATTEMPLPMALLRLGRFTPEEVTASGGSPELAARMKPMPAPPKVAGNRPVGLTGNTPQTGRGCSTVILAAVAAAAWLIA
jgi:hypothetical protein